ncbi:class I adenylate-forming enzyme family protein [Nocardia sp. BMG111209]|uniref:class I adenylate-forming enzyme family protein n=1 Tax=Nocardia sp. BMG111209 TaxID=1160137 RepID=UPI00036823BB|nr:class I adenylate-forming enzyme family protein [Nocardia sp. BMG111209]
MVTYHGILAAGAVVLPLDPRDPHRWTAVLGDAAALVTESALGIPDSAVPPAHTIVIGADPRGGIAWDEALRTAGDPGPVAGGDRRAVVLSSSGSAGIPKRVTVTHHNPVANLAQIHAIHRIAPGTTVAVVPPLRHIYGMQTALNPVLRAGGTLLVI